MSASNTKRKPDEESRSSFPGSYPKKPRIESSDSQTQSVLDLQNLLDISALQSQAELRTRFDELGAALLKDFCLVVHRESTHTSVELDILECEFYLWHDSDGLHEDPFTHGSLEQSVSGRWCVLYLALLSPADPSKVLSPYPKAVQRHKWKS